MGNEQSLSSSTEINHKAIEVTDFYTHHSASVNFGNVNNLSVFIGEEVLDGSIWIKQTPLEKSSKNLMVYRHPCILKYFSSWEKGSKFHLAVEDVKPLSLVLSTLNNLQICIGLYSILKALYFLHNIAEVSHNNVCLASIYIAKDGNWKLGGMEYLCKFKEMTLDYMGKTKKYRYNKGIDPNEMKYLGEKKLERRDFVDLYSFSVLVWDVLKKNDEIPFLGEFLELCRNDLQNSNINLRPKFDTLLEHDFFNHDFIKIHCFLTELPLKSDIEKNEFFTTLIGKLRNFDELIIASQLTNLLLSRMVLLNKTAQTNVIPFLLSPKEELDTEDENLGLFTTDTFKKYVIPKLLEIFCVRDAQIRLLLLEHLNHYINCFQIQELQSNILPELLVGVKDTNDQLVAITLRALADLVPILGAETVIGGKRAKLFNDGRPIQHLTRKQRKSIRKNDLNTPSNVCIEKDLLENRDILQDLPERPSPDGEEGETSTEDLEEEDNWEDWDLNEAQREITKDNLETSINAEMSSMSLGVNRKNSKKDLPDILELDIKNQKNKTDLDDIDFFQDMEPVIEVNKFNVEAKDVDVRKFGVVNEDKEEGWGDDDW
ncbi:protein-associating with the carboxyl-terminal domain of ezrin [Onthophagus taurus]|uniref:protein-associating with the carboxyl-terminal domain of ezrin n=1 Tax=Onthophagus taurus TaxID=166361 RepID=UPI000C20D105|nr:protein-associating with the carboxyl-terminal domain of ezrin [Onthophagus taurus]